MAKVRSRTTPWSSPLVNRSSQLSGLTAVVRSYFCMKPALDWLNEQLMK